MAVVILVSGSFVFAHIATAALHELGHVLAAWSTGGTVSDFRVHPLGDSSVLVQPDENPLLTHAGGFVLPPAMALLLLGRARQSPSRLAPPLLCTAIMSLGATGIYLLVGALARLGDPYVLQTLGIPTALLAAIGAAVLGAGVAVAATSLGRFGVPREDSWIRRSALLAGGVGPYLAALLLSQTIQASGSGGFWAAAVLAAAGAILAIAWLSSLADSRWPTLVVPYQSPRTYDLATAWGFAIAAISLAASTL